MPRPNVGQVQRPLRAEVGRSGQTVEIWCCSKIFTLLILLKPQRDCYKIFMGTLQQWPVHMHQVILAWASYDANSWQPAANMYSCQHCSATLPQHASKNCATVPLLIVQHLHCGTPVFWLTLTLLHSNSPAGHNFQLHRGDKLQRYPDSRRGHKNSLKDTYTTKHPAEFQYTTRKRGDFISVTA